MRTAFSAEFRKIRRRKVWLIVALMIFVQFLWAIWSFSKIDAAGLSQGWMRCLYVFPLLNSIMMPVIAAVVASRLCDIEHKGQMFKLLETVMPAGRIFDAKFLCGAVYMFAAAIAQAALIGMVGYVMGFTGGLPVDKLLVYLLFTATVSLAILLVQQILSLLFINQMIPLAVGLTGGLAGLYLMFFPQTLEKILLWGYYGVLMLVGMDWDRATRITNYHYVPADWGGFAALLVMFCVIYAAGRALFVRKEM